MAPDGDDDPAVKAFDLLKELVTLTQEKWITPSRFHALASRWAPDPVALQIRFLTEVKQILRTMPVQAYPDLDARQAVLDALQEALDVTINLEEGST